MPRRSSSGRLAALLILPALLVAAACGDSQDPEPGDVLVSLVSPAGDEGGAVFRIVGETVTTAGTGQGSVFVRQVEGESRVVLVREPAGPLSFTLTVDDVNRPPTVEVVEVVGPDDALRTTLSAYDVRVEALR